MSDDTQFIFCYYTFNYIHVLTFLYCQIKMLKGINHDQRNSLAWSDKHAHKYTQLKANWDLNWKRVSKECLRMIFVISQNFSSLKFFYIAIVLFWMINLWIIHWWSVYYLVDIWISYTSKNIHIKLQPWLMKIQNFCDTCSKWQKWDIIQMTESLVYWQELTTIKFLFFEYVSR